MTAVNDSLIPIVRRFNRFYTNVLGLLDRHLLDSEFSLSEARVLYELGQSEPCAAKALIDKLKLDAGYLSRMLKRFERLGLTERMPSKEDGRSYRISLTQRGREALTELEEQSDDQIRALLARLREQDQRSIARHMAAIESALSAKADQVRQIRIRSELKPGDAGALIHLHGWIYAQECGYNSIFEGYVCKTFSEFFERYAPDKDRFWFAEAGGEIVGAVAIVGHSAEKAQLRWFILHPEFRGLGLGRMLLGDALDYCRQKGFRRVFLETTEDQQTAIRMYTNAGFRKTDERPNRAWGVDHIEQTYELDLS